LLSASSMRRVLVPTVRQTAVTASLDFGTVLPLQPAVGYTTFLKCVDILRAQSAAGRELIPDMWLGRVFVLF